MALEEYKATFNANGFIPGVDISEGEWALIVAEFVDMHAKFAYMTNQVIDRLNTTWRKYENIKAVDDIMGSYMSTLEAQEAMGIDENTTYIDWIERWFADICVTIDEVAMMSGFHIRSDLFRDGDLLVYGAKFKDNPEWKINFSLEQVVK